MLRVGVDSRAVAHSEDLDAGKDTDHKHQETYAVIEALTGSVLEERD